MEEHHPPPYSADSPDRSGSENNQAVTYTNNTVNASEKKKKRFSCPYIFFNGFMSGIALILTLCFSGMMILIYPNNATNNAYFFNIINFILGDFAGIITRNDSQKKKKKRDEDFS